jgi:hypothetical protein
MALRPCWCQIQKKLTRFFSVEKGPTWPSVHSRPSVHGHICSLQVKNAEKCLKCFYNILHKEINFRVDTELLYIYIYISYKSYKLE